MKKIHGFLPRASSGLADHATLCKAPCFQLGKPWQRQGRLGKRVANHAQSVVNLIILTFAFAQMASAVDWYVATNGTGGGTSWADATNSLQGAIVASAAADTVWVSNGVYEAGGITNYPTGTLLTNRVAINKAITVRAFSTNPADTLIKGAGPNGPAAVRCVWMTNGSTLIGFTLTNGATFAGGANVERGGGVSCQSTNTTISNCVLTGNSAYYGGGASYGTLFNCTIGVTNSAVFGAGTYYATLFDCTVVSNYSSADGGGAYYGTLYNCTLIGNKALWGGGVVSATLTNCTLSGNWASQGGGGVYGGTLYNCILTNNSSSSGNGGGGAYGGTFYNCTLVNNVNPYYGGGVRGGTLFNCKLIGNYTYWGALNSGGGAYGCTLYNCTVSGNSSEYPAGLAGKGGGVRDSTLYNCTLTGNKAYHGGGVSGGSLINCIVYGNTAVTAGSNWYEVVTFTNTCTVPAATNGVGNITDNPLFIDPGSDYGLSHVAGNYRLRNISPPLNAGTNFLYMTDPTDVRSKDLDGQPRIDNFGKQVDMGCYELMLRGTTFMFGQ